MNRIGTFPLNNCDINGTMGRKLNMRVCTSSKRKLEAVTSSKRKVIVVTAGG
jgi:hypothetical protein